MGEWRKQFRFLESSTRIARNKALAVVAREAMARMRGIIIREGAVSPIKKERKLVDSIRLKRIKEGVISIYPAVPYAIFVDQGTKASPGRYCPYIGLKHRKEKLVRKFTKEDWRQPHYYGIGKRLKHGMHPGFRGINFSGKTVAYLIAEGRRLFIDEFRRLGVWAAS